MNKAYKAFICCILMLCIYGIQKDKEMHAKRYSGLSFFILNPIFAHSV
jgi:hypothetical protein